MTINVNGKLMELPDNITVSLAIREVGITSFNGVAIAINNHVLKKEEWDSQKLNPQDVIVIIRASQGG
jgi:sulfur carrier protein